MANNATEDLTHKVYSNIGNQHVLKLVESNCNKILDIGCGAGDNARILNSEGKTVDGISYSQDELDVAQQYLRNGYVFDLENGLPPEIHDDEYDCIICSHVLEHIAYPQQLFKDIQRVLKKGGIIIVALPNVFFYKFRFTLMRGNFPVADSGIWDYTHMRWYTFLSAKNMLNEYFDVDVATVTGEIPFNGLFKYILPKSVRKQIYNLLTKISKGFFGFQLLYRAKSN